ncbi:Outer membrane lipoprotein LolB [Methylophaga frappieri]|uniref:Outer-membrane lipoprotein LolB n=1 Tax=Methylophaga frappieri (strain ATCC BAA-2434 / DSM 25690 / JAM7) TaxID=754477 RepID=I1YJZ2_METFJ|nr:lipoprotein insertase outer membrane protein LolB [Methylophaga frappieri]AFJ03235.1 Outer membrane lipoprotein LolB [Methylophaga frappieri]
MIKKLLLLTLWVLVSGCSTLWQSKPQAPAETLWLERQSQLKQLDNWTLRGRTAIQQGKEGWNAGVSWHQSPDQFEIRLTGPFSQGAVNLSGDQNAVLLTNSSGERYVAATPEQLLEEVLGWQLPISALRDWVKGLPFSEAAVTYRELDRDGRLVALEQAGWQVSFMRYVPFQGTDVPDKIFIKRDQLSVRLVVSAWQSE